MFRLECSENLRHDHAGGNVAERSTNLLGFQRRRNLRSGSRHENHTGTRSTADRSTTHRLLCR